MQTTRREALVAITGSAAVSAACSSPSVDPAADLSPETVDRFGLLADVIIPETDTPGARAAGVADLLAQDAAEDDELKARVRELVERFASDGFFEKNEADQEALMGEYMNASDERAELFRFLKDRTIDYYYSTQVGLVDELGYQGNTYLMEYPGCRHDHELDDRGAGEA